MVSSALKAASTYTGPAKPCSAALNTPSAGFSGSVTASFTGFSTTTPWAALNASFRAVTTAVEETVAPEMASMSETEAGTALPMN